MAFCFLRLKKSTLPLNTPTRTKTGLHCTCWAESHVLATDNNIFMIGVFLRFLTSQTLRNRDCVSTPPLENVASKSSEKSFLSRLVQQETNAEYAAACGGHICSVLKEEKLRAESLFLQQRKSGLVRREEKKRALQGRRQTRARAARAQCRCQAPRLSPSVKRELFNEKLGNTLVLDLLEENVKIWHLIRTNRGTLCCALQWNHTLLMKRYFESLLA